MSIQIPIPNIDLMGCEIVFRKISSTTLGIAIGTSSGSYMMNNSSYGTGGNINMISTQYVTSFICLQTATDDYVWAQN